MDEKVRKKDEDRKRNTEAFEHTELNSCKCIYCSAAQQHSHISTRKKHASSR